MKRTPDDILKDFDVAVKGQADIDPYEILFEIIEDVIDSAILAAANHVFDTEDLASIRHEIEDYVSNTYGD